MFAVFCQKSLEVPELAGFQPKRQVRDGGYQVDKVQNTVICNSFPLFHALQETSCCALSKDAATACNIGILLERMVTII